MRSVLSLLLMFVLLSACAPMGMDESELPDDNLPAGALGQVEVFTLFNEMTVESVTLNKGRVSLTYYGPSGVVRQLQEGERRKGTWRVGKNGRICLAMEGGREKCRVIVREPDGSYRKYVVKKDGNHQPVVGYRSFVPGNPQGL